MINNEAYIAGCLLIDGSEVIRVICGIVKADDFQAEVYRAIFTAALSLVERDEPIDPVALREEAARQGVELPNELLVELMECTPTAAHCAEYAQRVAEDARTRQIKALANGYRKTPRPPLTSSLRRYRGKPRPSGAAASSGGCSVQPTPSTGSMT